MTNANAAKLFKVLSDEINLICVQLLMNNGEMYFGNFMKEFSYMDPHDIIEHLQVLLDNELINAFQMKDSEELVFVINKETVDNLMSYVYMEKGSEEEHKCCCGHHHHHEHKHNHECGCGEHHDSECRCGEDEECCCCDDDCECCDEDNFTIQGEGADLDGNDDPSDPYKVSK